MPIKLNGRTFNTGDGVTFNDNARGICHGPSGLKVTIRKIQDLGNTYKTIGLHSPNQRVEDWHDLDGEVGHCRGWWIRANDLEKCIQESNDEYIIDKLIEHRGIQLKDKRCLVLGHLDNGLVFVEFKENVNGCSADGLGKAGHCVAVKSDILTKKKREKHVK